MGLRDEVMGDEGCAVSLRGEGRVKREVFKGDGVMFSVKVKGVMLVRVLSERKRPVVKGC